MFLVITTGSLGNEGINIKPHVVIIHHQDEGRKGAGVIKAWLTLSQHVAGHASRGRPVISMLLRFAA